MPAALAGQPATISVFISSSTQQKPMLSGVHRTVKVGCLVGRRRAVGNVRAAHADAEPIVVAMADRLPTPAAGPRERNRRRER
jgi:hypothetical protein